MLWWLATVNEKSALDGSGPSPGSLAKGLISSVTQCLNLTSSSPSPCFILKLQPFLSILPITFISLTTWLNVRFLSLSSLCFRFFCWAAFVALSVPFPAFVSLKPLVPLFLVCSRRHITNTNSYFQHYARPIGTNIERKCPVTDKTLKL